MHSRRAWSWIGLVVVLALSGATPCAGNEPSAAWMDGGVEFARVNLNPAGADIGFEITVAGDHPAVAAMLDLIAKSPPGADHKCSNIGAVRLFGADGTTRGVGLLPSHSQGEFELRLYEDGRLVSLVEVDLAELQEVLALFGVSHREPIMSSPDSLRR